MIIRLIVSAWILGSLALGSWVAWMALDNEPPYTWEGSDGGSRIIPDPAPQGSNVTADWKLTKVNRLCPASVQRFFRDHETGRVVATLDTTEASRAVKAGDERLPRSFQLPPNLPPTTDYSTMVCFSCNLMQVISPLCVMTPNITFRTLPPHSLPAIP